MGWLKAIQAAWSMWLINFTVFKAVTYRGISFLIIK